MNTSTRTALTSALSDQVATIAAELREQMLAPGPVRQAAEQLHQDEQVGDDFDVWTDLLSRRAAVLFVLKTVYVRVLEDRGAIQPVRIVDPESQALFEQLAPNLGETTYLQWVFRDLAQPHGGLPELFAPQPAEIGTPSHESAQALLRLWRERDPDTGELRYRFDGERFDGALMGDLYQDLDPVVKARYALLQTPDFVREFMLDQTLTPAIEQYGASQVRVIDPACGSGHFLLEAFRRLVEATAAEQPDWSRMKVVRHTLARVVGIDLNDYACALARARLVMLALELAGGGDLAEAAAFAPQVFWADGLDQVERDPELERQIGLFSGEVPPPRATLSRPEVRRELRGVLEGGFQVVVANPPYITEKDPARKEYHREKIGKQRRYVSSSGKYSLASPFTERCFQLAVDGGFVGLITSNNFMKRTFGKALIEEVLAAVDLTLVVDSSGAFIPGHGTPTVIFFGRNHAPQSETVRAVMGKRGEPSNPDDPAKGLVWTSIVDAHQSNDFENEFISSADLSRAVLAEHPWSLQGGGASALRNQLEAAGASSLNDNVESIGVDTITRAADLMEHSTDFFLRRGVEAAALKWHQTGEGVRDWAASTNEKIPVPYEWESQEILSIGRFPGLESFYWHHRTWLGRRFVSGGTRLCDVGAPYWSIPQFPTEKHKTRLSITFAEVATHNHFVLDRGGKVFKQTAPVIKLPADATEEDHLALLGLLNSSVADFWAKQIFHSKGNGGVNEGMRFERWEPFYQRDSTKLKLFPVPTGSPLRHARALDALATQRTEHSVRAVLDDPTWSSGSDLMSLLEARRAADFDQLQQMVALQEELDWRCYQLYGLDQGTALAPDDVTPLPPTLRPMELLLARKDAEIRRQLANDEPVHESPTAWFERHGWDPVIELPADLDPTVRDLFQARLDRIAASKELQLLERPEYKRRWYKPDYAAEEHAALETWLTDRIEDAFAQHSQPRTARQIAAELQADPRFLAAAELYTGRNDFELASLVQQLTDAEAVPNHPLHLYNPKGLKKRAAWEKTWADQRREDAGEDVTPKVPPKYTGADFLRSEYYQLRGKLDVPKERFIALTEVPRLDDDDPLYAWAGWTPAQRLTAYVDLDEQLEDQGYDVPDRIALLDSAWRLLPDVERDAPDEARRARVDLVAIVGQNGPSSEALKRWIDAHPPPGKRSKRS